MDTGNEKGEKRGREREEEKKNRGATHRQGGGDAYDKGDKE